MTKVAICGLGRIGQVHLQNLKSLRGCEISGAFDLRAELREHFAKSEGVRAYCSWDELIDDEESDAVIIATPTSSHRELTLAALARDKHVFVEKPLAGTLEDAQAIVDAAGISDRCVQVGFCERFNPQYMEAKRAVAAGALGSVRAIYSSRVAPYSLSDPSWELGVLDTAVHNFDLILWLTGGIPMTVQSRGVQLYAESAIPHTATVILQFADGAFATDQITWLRDSAHPLSQCARARMLVLGSRGSFEIDLSQRPSALLTADQYRMIDTVILGAPEYYSCLKLQLEGFLRAVEEGSPVLAAPADALLTERVAIAARQSLLSGGQELSLV
ncbi:MAG: Gfo/Idh/MocA family oxidoreductase [Acidobacteriaceae bacterium]|nr:Gfo/Idh/MocA family oxidoreductase [Acidobacteriaceae bacterium]